MEDWEENIGIVEEIVYAHLLKMLRRTPTFTSQDPLSLYAKSKAKKSDLGIMVDEECPLCTSLYWKWRYSSYNNTIIICGLIKNVFLNSRITTG